MELEAEIAKLKEENERLQKTQVLSGSVQQVCAKKDQISALN